MQQTMRDSNAITDVCGGVDSYVAAFVAKRALGDRLLPVFIDTGFLRAAEPENVKARLEETWLGFRVKLVKAGGRFLEATRGEAMAEEKRNKFRETVYQLLGDGARTNGCEVIVP